jgi:hypothetical protein
LVYLKKIICLIQTLTKILYYLLSWFIASLTIISNLDTYLKMIAPEDNQSYEDENYCGIFHFRFWRFGEWIDVCIDDRLPVDQNNNIIFCHNKADLNDVLGALIEKAYAKLVTCYEFLNGGESIDALIDLTGSIYYQHVRLNKLRLVSNFDCKKTYLWSLLLDAYFNKSALVVASIKNFKNNEIFDKIENVSLIYGHSYSVIQVFEIFSNSSLKESFKRDDEMSSNSIKLLK